ERAAGRVGHDEADGLRLGERRKGEGGGRAQEESSLHRRGVRGQSSPCLSASEVKESARNSSCGKPQVSTKSRCADSTMIGAPQAYTWWPERSGKSSITARCTKPVRP